MVDKNVKDQGGGKRGKQTNIPLWKKEPSGYNLPQKGDGAFDSPSVDNQASKEKDCKYKEGEAEGEVARMRIVTSFKAENNQGQSKGEANTFARLE